MNEDLKIKYDKLKNFIDSLTLPIIIAIEGKCASGKTTLANEFINKATIIHIDDFFLPPEAKTNERLSEVGGNVNYEAIKELLELIKSKKMIKYNKYDCHQNTYTEVTLPYNDIIILEGVYSFHPFFNKLIDKLVYIDIDEITQAKRISARPNASRFFNEWMKYENTYYEKTNILNNIDLLL